jgi:hypothetical protein
MKFEDSIHQAAYQRGVAATDNSVHTYLERIYNTARDFPLIAEGDPQSPTKQVVLYCLDRAYEDYRGALPWMLLNRMADALVYRDGSSATVIAPDMVIETDEPLLLDACIHALEATTRVNLDLMQRTSEAAGRIYMHAHDCDDCGIAAAINIESLDAHGISRFGGNFISQLFASLEAIRADLPFKMLEKCGAIPASYKLQ